MDCLSISAISVAQDDARGELYERFEDLADTDVRRRLAELVSMHAGVEPSELVMLNPQRPGAAESARRALAGLRSPARPQLVVLVQDCPDLDFLDLPLPRLLHESGWAVSEELGVSHGGRPAGLEVFEILRWALPAGRGADVVISDRPAYGERSRPPGGGTVAVRVVAGSGPVAVIGWGTGTSPAADRHLRGLGPSDVWESLHASLTACPGRPGERLVLEVEDPPSGPGIARWLLVEAGQQAPHLACASGLGANSGSSGLRGDDDVQDR